MIYKAPILLACTLGLLTACGQSPDPEVAAPTDSRVPADNVFSDQVRALEKAEDVEKTILDADARRRDVLEGQGN